MGLVYTSLTLSNPVIQELKSITISALVDTGSTYLCIPEHIAYQLQLKEHQKREVTLADGSIRQVPYVGPIQVNFDNRVCFVGAMVLGDSVLLGAVPMEDMDLVVHPKTFSVVVNPNNPNIAHGMAKSFKK